VRRNHNRVQLCSCVIGENESAGSIGDVGCLTNIEHIYCWRNIARHTLVISRWTVEHDRWQTTADVAVAVSTVNAYQWSYEKNLSPLCDILKETEVWGYPADATRCNHYTIRVTCGWMNTLILLMPFKFVWDKIQKYFYELLVPEGK
jgi:hypothetical protein